MLYLLIAELVEQKARRGGMLFEVVHVVAASGIEDSVGTPMNCHQKPFADDHVEPLAGIVRATGSPAQEREQENLIRPSQRGRRR